MLVQHPFQRISLPGRVSDSLYTVLAAAGPHIFVLNLLDGAILSKWPYEDTSTRVKSTLIPSGANRSVSGEPPEKKRRLSASQEDGSSPKSSSSVEIETERIKGQRRKPKPKPDLPNVSHLLTTRDGGHVIALTAEDKCVRVFKIDEQGRLNVLSERCMPKRPCAIVLCPEERDLLVADKFGDVYSLPLFPGRTSSNSQTPLHARKTTVSDPSASELTVHTKGNREALRQQRLRRASGEKKPEKVVLNFEHTLLLGHVSLLTDLRIAILPPNTSTNRSDKVRRFLITTDRDEHIRISRGPPQAHVIEGYCHGHKHFVSKACVLPWQPEILIAGSGAPSVRAYVWPEGRPMSDKNYLEEGEIPREWRHLRPRLDTDLRKDQYAVSGLWTMGLSSRNPSEDPSGFVFVALEGLPILLTFIKSLKHDLIPCDPIRLAGNPLDVAVAHSEQTLLVSIDGAHIRGSTKTARMADPSSAPFLQAFTLKIIEPNPKEQKLDSDHSSQFPDQQFLWPESPRLDLVKRNIAREGTITVDIPTTLDEKATYSPLGEFLYGLESLRKKPVQERAEEEGNEKAERAIPPPEMLTKERPEANEQ